MAKILVRGQGARCISGEASFASLQALFRPAIVHRRGDIRASAEFGDAFLSTQALQHNAESSPQPKTVDVSHTPMSLIASSVGWFAAPEFLLIFAPCGNDHPDGHAFAPCVYFRTHMSPAPVDIAPPATVHGEVCAQDNDRSVTLVICHTDPIERIFLFNSCCLNADYRENVAYNSTALYEYHSLDRDPILHRADRHFSGLNHKYSRRR